MDVCITTNRMDVFESLLRVLIHTWIGNTVAEAVLLLICASNGLAGCAVALAVEVTSLSPAAPVKVDNDFLSVDAKTRAVGVTMSMGACTIGS